MDANTKIVYGLERLSDVFKSLLWDSAKVHGISPIQIQIMLFIRAHDVELCNVSHLAREFALTKPTVSDAVNVLCKKEFLEKDPSMVDSRSYSLRLTESGRTLADSLSTFASPLTRILQEMGTTQREALLDAVIHLIGQLNKSGILEVQRMCFGCRFYAHINGQHRCNLLQANLASTDIRLDCPEFESKATSS